AGPDFTVGLFDIYLGAEGNGIEVARDLQQRASLPIVFMSAHSDSRTLEEALSVSPYGYLAKPFELKDMLVTLTMAIARHEQERRDRERAAQLQDDRLLLLCQIRRDLGVPMAAVGLTLDRLRQQGRSMNGAQVEAALTRIERSVQNMQHILDDCWERLYCESVRRPLRVQAMTPQFLQEHLCGDVVTMLWDTAIAKTCPIVACYEFTTTAIALDAPLVWVILHTLLANAVKYSFPAQTVRLQVQVTPQTVQFQVGDRGIGIPQELMNELLALFNRTGKVAEVPGRGVGLYTVKQAVESHHGTISVESVLHQGTTFTVTLPNFAWGADPDPDAQPAENPAGQPLSNFRWFSPGGSVAGRC
ncbi:MAG: hybrid sensor histidine kinase/response regulator, partial [Pseudanabaenaceae cyanobacterium]